jgi:integrase
MARDAKLRIVELKRDDSKKGEGIVFKSAYDQGWRYMVTGPRIKGKRWRHFFKTKTEAKTDRDAQEIELQNYGTSGAGISETLRSMAAECSELLKPYNSTIRQASEFFVAHLEKQKRIKNSKTVDVVAAEYLEHAEKRNLRQRTKNDLRSRIGKVSKFFAGRAIADLTPKDINSFIDHVGGSARSKINYTSKASQLFHFARRQGYVEANPCEMAERIQADEDGEISILKVPDLISLLSATLSTHSDLIPYISIAAFAGLRASELNQLDWKEINFDENLIEVKGVKAKTRQRRLVDMSDNLAAWILPYRKKQGPVVAPFVNKFPFRFRWEQVRRAAGYACGIPFENETPQHTKHLIPWPSNCLRHSCASYRTAKEQDLAKVALQMGHDADMLVRHYRNLVTPKAAEEYWQILPDQKAVVLPFAQRA